MFIFLGVLGLIPWTFIWVLVLATIFGLGNVSIKVNLIFVLGITVVQNKIGVEPSSGVGFG